LSIFISLIAPIRFIRVIRGKKIPETNTRQPFSARIHVLFIAGAGVGGKALIM